MITIMEEIIKIKTEQNGKQVVSARETYLALGLDLSQWSRWTKKNITDNTFVAEGVDWEGFDIMSNGNKITDFVITLDFAKRIAMMARTEKGEEIRQYFLKCERAVNQQKLLSPIEMAQMFIEAEREKEKVLLQLNAANEEIKVANEKIEKDKSKVIFADSVSGSGNAILIRQFAKDLTDSGFEIGQNRLFEWFRENKYLSVNNEPYQNWIAQGLFEVIVRTIGSGVETITVRTTKITGKGCVYFANKIKSNFENITNNLFIEL